MTIVFQSFKVFRIFFIILLSFQKRQICPPNGTLKIHFFATHVKTKFKVLMKNYLSANLDSITLKV